MYTTRKSPEQLLDMMSYTYMCKNFLTKYSVLLQRFHPSSLYIFIHTLTLFTLKLGWIYILLISNKKLLKKIISYYYVYE